MIELVTEFNLEVVTDIVRLDAEAFGAGGLNEWHLVPLIRYGRVFIYRYNGQVVGTVQYLRDWDQPQTAYMYGITVDQALRGKGIAKKMLQGSLAIIFQSGIAICELTVDPVNTALSLYEKIGFRRTGFRENEFGPGENRLILKLSAEDFQPNQPKE